jgi:hypothetical protein
VLFQVLESMSRGISSSCVCVWGGGGCLDGCEWVCGCVCVWKVYIYMCVCMKVCVYMHVPTDIYCT